MTNAKNPPKLAAAAKATTPNAWAKWKADPDASLANLCMMIRDGMSITAVARELKVNRSTLEVWIGDDPSRSARVREARIASAQAYDEMALEEINQAANPFELARAKEMAHHLRWRASKINPRDYGEKVELEHKGNLGDLTDSQIEARIKALTAKVASDGPSEPVGS